MKSSDVGHILRKRRKELGLRQLDVSFSTGIGTRFISELENGKPTCELGKTLQVIEALGLKIELRER